MGTKKISKGKLIKCITAISVLLSVVSLLFTAISGCLLFKLIRYINTAQKAVPTMEKAAQLYLEKNSSDDEADDDDDDDIEDDDNSDDISF
jgi:hypothetical protein